MMRDTIASIIVDDTFQDMTRVYYDCLKLRKTEPEIAKHGVKAFRIFCRDRIGTLQLFLKLDRAMPPSMQMQEETKTIINKEITALRAALNTTRRS